MNSEDNKKLMLLIEEIKKLLPQFDSIMLTEDALIITSLEHAEAVAESMGYEVNVDNTLDEDDLLDFYGFDDDDEDKGNGGILQ